MTVERTYRRAREEDMDGLYSALRRAFHLWTREGWENWLEWVGVDAFRIAEIQGKIAGGLAIHELGQYFGGRRVPMAGIAAVGVSPEYRGRRVARDLMREAHKELREREVPLATLYPSAQGLYRATGYEQAGTQWNVEIAASDIAWMDRDLTMRRTTREDWESIREAHRAHASRIPGHLDRNRYLWEVVGQGNGKKSDGYVVEEAGEITGYLFHVSNEAEDFRTDFFLRDMVALTEGAARRLLTFLADHRSLVRKVCWRSSPSDPLLTLLPEQKYRFVRGEHWMLRIVDIQRALVARGWPQGMRASLDLEIGDTELPANSGRYRLEVSDGEAQVEPGGSGDLRLDIRGLAGLYTGHLSPRALRIAGLLDGSEDAARTAESLFAGPAPWMADRF